MCNLCVNSAPVYRKDRRLQILVCKGNAGSHRWWSGQTDLLQEMQHRMEWNRSYFKKSVFEYNELRSVKPNAMYIYK